MSAAWDELRALARALPPDVARALAAAWARDAQFEHASIASFSRFALELLSVAAPAELVASAHRAALDEVEHAQLCFSLASVYAGVALGPAALPLDASAFATPALSSMAHACVLEGCVNETLAALEARAAHPAAEPAAVRDALQAIERQESEHAALAFRFVSWAVGVGGVEVRAAARAAFAEAEAQIRAAAAVSDPLSRDFEAALRRHGRLSARERSELRRRALAEVIAPAARDLLG
jgi:hypothetical protein